MSEKIMDLDINGEFDAVEEVVDQKEVNGYLKGEEDINYDDSLWTALGQMFDSLFKSVYVVLGRWEIDYPEAYNAQASEMLLKCFQAKRLNLVNIVNLLEKGADPNTRFEDNFRQSLLHAAVRKVSYRAVKYLVDAGADVNALNTRHQTPLMLACDSKIDHHIHIIRFLCGCQGINLHVRDAGGNSALVNAIFKEQPHFVRVLLRAGCRALDERNGPSGWEIAQFVFASGMYLEAKHLPPHFVRPKSFIYKHFDLKGAYRYSIQVWLQNQFKYDALLNYRILQRRVAEEEQQTALVPVKQWGPQRDPAELKKEADARARERKIRELTDRKQRKDEDAMREWQRMKEAVAQKVDREFSKKLRNNMNDKTYEWERDKQGEWHKNYAKKTSIYKKTPTPDTSYMTSNRNMAGTFLSPKKKTDYVAADAKDDSENVPDIYKKDGITADSMNWIKDKKTGKWTVVKGGFRELGFFDATSGWVKNQERELQRRSKLDDLLEDDEDDMYFHENF